VVVLCCVEWWWLSLLLISELIFYVLCANKLSEINPVKEIPVIFHGDFKLFER